VNSDLESRAGREQALLAARLLGRRGDDPLADIVIGPAFTSGGYFYALVSPNGELLAATANVDPAGLAGAGASKRADGGERLHEHRVVGRRFARVTPVRLQGPASC
jgi:hypothetical protein